MGNFWIPLLQAFGIKPKPKTMAAPNTFKGVAFDGAYFPYDPYKTVKVTLNDTIKREYLPLLNLMDLPQGLKLLMTAMTKVEGFQKGTRSYRTNNPGNIGNTDLGDNKILATLEDGIRVQARFLQDIAAGKKKPYPLGKVKDLPPTFSQEIQNNLKVYNAKDGWLPGYKFTYTGTLEQFLKIYATLPRINNSYINTIVSYFKANGVEITPQTTLAEIVSMK